MDQLRRRQYSRTIRGDASYMSKPCPDKLSDAIHDVEKLVEECKERLDHLLEQRDPQNIRDQVLAISLTRILKYAEAFVLLGRSGYGEPAACLLRSVFEGYLWIRWSVLSQENAEAYFNSGKGEGIRMLDKLIGRGLVAIKNRISGEIPSPELIQAMLKDELKGSLAPAWVKMAKDADLSDLFALIYPILSGMAHGSLLFLGERMERATVSPDANWDNIGPFLPIANNLMLDSFRVTERWIRQREVEPLPSWTSRTSFTR